MAWTPAVGEIAFIDCTSLYKVSIDSTYSKSRAIKSCVSTSAADPRAIYRNCMYSLFVCLAAPSAIFDGIDTLARCIWFVNPNFSSEGNSFVRRYNPETKRIEYCHTSSCLSSLAPLFPFSIHHFPFS